MGWPRRPRPIYRPFASVEAIQARALVAWSTNDTTLKHWWCGRFNRPPNDPLFLSETSAYWSQFFYEDICKERDHLEARHKELVAQITGTKDEVAARREETKQIESRYHELGKVLGLIEEQPEDTRG